MPRAQLREFLALLKLLSRPDRKLIDSCNFYTLDEMDSVALALLLVSLLLRSPARRFTFERTGSSLGFGPNENVGKANILQFYRIARASVQRSQARGISFILIRAPLKGFIFGDGMLDWMTDSLVGVNLRGRALVPLTPTLCIYMCTPAERYGSWNCASFFAAPWMVDTINGLTQAYSRDILFFRGNPPKLTEDFKRGEFMSHTLRTDHFVSLLDEIAEGRRWV